MKTLTLHNIPEKLYAAIETQARLHQCSVEEEMRHMLEQVAEPVQAAATVPPPATELGEKSKRNALADLLAAIPPEARLTEEEAEMFRNIRYETSFKSARTK